MGANRCPFFNDTYLSKPAAAPGGDKTHAEEDEAEQSSRSEPHLQ